MREGSLEAPIRPDLDWHYPLFWDEGALEKEMELARQVQHAPRRAHRRCA